MAGFSHFVRITTGGVDVRKSVRIQLEEMVEYIEFPMGVYVYETGKVLAANRRAKEILNGTSCQNVNLLLPGQKRFKLSPEVLEGKSQIFLNQELQIGEDSCLVDMELMVMPLPGEHIVIVFLERSYRQAFRTDVCKLLPGMIWINAQGEYVTMNSALQLGVGRFLYLKEHKEEASEKEERMLQVIAREYEQIVESKQPSFCNVEQVDFNGENSGYVTMNKLPVLGKQEELLGVLMLCNAVVSQQEYQELYDQARFENALLRECIMTDYKIVLGVSGTEEMVLRYATPNLKLLGYDQEQVLLRNVSWRDLICPDDRERVEQERQEAFLKKEPFLKQKYRVVSADGKTQWVDTIKTCHTGGADRWNYMVVSLTTAAKEHEHRVQVQVKRETYLDFLTGLPNRLKYEEDTREQIEAAMVSNQKGYVIALDLDDFKHINEGLGPEYGDMLLKQVSKALNDIPQVENQCYRVDGDEFVLFLSGIYANELEDTIQRCLELFQESWQLEDKDCFCSVSIGIAEYPKDSTHSRELLKCADAAVYEAKRKGKNRIQYYKKAVLNTSVERVNYEKYLRKAIAKGCVEFEMFFQPIVKNQTKEVVSAEALVRWYSPELGFITPIHFISLSEYLGLIVPLGEYVLQQSFSQCKYWNDHYDPDFKVSVNLSVVQLVQRSIVDRIMEIARATGVNTENIILEVTESLAVEDMNLMKSVLQELREHGFSIALDDFGTGYSSLNHIMEMPLNYVKIDRSFVSGYGTESFNPSLLSAISELAHSVQMEVIVEGVETKQQMEFLMFLQADKLQGYLYGKPMSAAEFEQRFLEVKE